MATSVTKAQQDQIAQLYVSLFDRAPDAGGFAGWVESLSKGTSLDVIAQDFYLSPEGQATYSRALTNQQFVEAFYTKFLGRNLITEDQGGITYWVGRLGETGATQGAIVAEIIKNIVNYTGTDPVVLASKAIIDAKVAVGEHYALVLNGGVTGAAAAVDGVTDAATAAAKIADLGVSGTIGETFTLTTGLDTIVGTAGNDTINAIGNSPVTSLDADTLTAFDSIDGGAGVDTLNIVPTTKNLAQVGTIKNVEIINIDNTVALFAAAGLDASKFVGATVINQIAAAAAVTKLAATTTAKFTDIASGTLDVTAADAAASVTVALNNVDDLTTLDVKATATGALDSVIVSGAVVDTAAADGVGAIALGVTTGKDVQTLTLNTAVDVTLTVTENFVAKHVSTVNAAASTGAVAYVADGTVANITTGAGADDVTLATAFTATLTAASVDGGAGNDTLVVAVDNTVDAIGAAVTATGGLGNDDITVNVVEGATHAVAITVNAGEGDDIVRIQDGAGNYRALTDNDHLDGGAGNDTIVVGAASPVLDSGDYVRLQDLKGFEFLQFQDTVGTGTAVDAAELTGYSKITFNGAASFVENVTAAQSLVSGNGDLTATTKGYDAAATDTNNAADALTITSLKTGTLDLFAKSANLIVDAASAEANVLSTVTGDLDSAVVTLTSGTDAAKTTDYVASVKFDVSAENPTLTSLTISGAGSATVVGGAKLATVDTSGLVGTDINGDAFNGLDFTGAVGVKETVKVGSGIDAITIASAAGNSSLSMMDTITGLNLTLNAAGDNFAATSDTFSFNVSGISVAAAFTTKTFTTAPASIGAALNTVSALASDAVVFQFQGNTYLFVEDTIGGAAANGNFEATDFVVKLTGAYDLDTVATLATLSL